MITLASDFGTPYPAAMRGVIYRDSDARVVDIAHDLPAHDPRAAAFWLRFVLPEYPPAVHCAVIDPGVGTDRDAVVFRAGCHAIVAPDNGLGFPPARLLAFDERESDTHASSPDIGRKEDDTPGPDGVEVYRVTVTDPASSTFHGRDVFAPLAAEIHRTGIEKLTSIDRLEPAPNPVKLTLPDASITRDDDIVAEGQILAVDRFGNAITNIPGDTVPTPDRVEVNGDRVPFGDTFAAVQSGERIVVVGSHGYVECDVREGSGSDAFDLEVSDTVTIQF